LSSSFFTSLPSKSQKTRTIKEQIRKEKLLHYYYFFLFFIFDPNQQQRQSFFSPYFLSIPKRRSNMNTLITGIE